jgi:hypothetical protein
LRQSNDKVLEVPPPARLTLGQWFAALTPVQLWVIGGAVFTMLTSAAKIGDSIGVARTERTAAGPPASVTPNGTPPTQSKAADFPRFLLGPWRVETKGAAPFSFEMVIAPSASSTDPGRFVGAMYTPASTDGKSQVSAVEGKITAHDASTATIEFTRTYVDRGKTVLVTPQLFNGTVIDGSVPIMKGKFNTFGRPLEFEWSASRSAG